MKKKKGLSKEIKPKSHKKDQNALSGIFNRRIMIIVIFAFYFAFVLVSRIPIIAQDSYTENMEESYTHHLTYKIDGRQGHYYVERYDTTQYGYIDLTYTTASNSLEVDCRNVKVLWIYSRSMYADECEDVYGIDPESDSNYYKKYFIARDLFHVHVYTKFMIQNLTFIDVPLPYNVTVNNEEWWIADLNYTYDGQSVVFTKVPTGHTYVDIYFQKPSSLAPVAQFTVSSNMATLNEDLVFDATDSYDPDGYITTYIWDFGNGDFASDMVTTYSFDQPGKYSVILTIIDNDNLISRGYTSISVTNETSPRPRILDRIPDQIYPEDSEPWSLELTSFGWDIKDTGIDLNWYLTGVDYTLYTVTGEWSYDDTLTFQPIPNAFGDNKVTLWLIDSDGYTDYQHMWINITSVNDPPVFFGAPDIILHYDDDYNFNFEPYIYDIETSKENLELKALETTEETYATVNGLNVTYNYPIRFLDEEVFVTISVSDGEATSADIIKITILDDWVPELVNELPDVILYEGTIVRNVFDLDDYFIDPDEDSLYYSYGETHVSVIINNDHSVDVSSYSEWSGIDTITFRAEDPIGALAEDTILVTVLPVNDPPKISGVPDLIVHYDYDYEFDLTAYIIDKDNSTDELRVFSSELDYIRFDDNNHMLMIVNFPQVMDGLTVPITIFVSDGLGLGSQIVNITVTDDYPPDLLTSLPDVQFEEDSELSRVFDLDNFFFDLDGDSLYYSYGEANIIVTINGDNTVNFAATPDWFGMEIVKFRAEDPIGALAEDTIIVTVLPVNDAPIVNDVPDQKGEVGEMWVLDISEYVEDVDNNITELELQVDSEYVVVSGLKLVFFSEKPVDNKDITLLVSDGDENTLHTFSVTFTAGESVVTVSEVFYWSLLVIIIIIVISAIVVVKKYKGNYKIEEVFVIHEDGTLLLHKSKVKAKALDDDILGGMLTAVQDFIREGFSSESPGAFPRGAHPDPGARKNDEWQLHQLKLEDHNILIERGKNAYLAVIFKGTSGWKLTRQVKNIMIDVENQYGKLLVDWNGRMNKIKGMEELISPLLSGKDPKV